MTNGDDPNRGQPRQPPGQQYQQPYQQPGQQPGHPPPGYPSAGAAPGYPLPGYQPGMQQQPLMQVPFQEAPRPGFLMPGIWLGVAALVTLAMVAYVGMMAWGSESAGVQATYRAALPLGTVWAGSITALAVHLFYKKGSRGVRVGVPLGCGCLGGLILFGMIMVFFVAIFPAL